MGEQHTNENGYYCNKKAMLSTESKIRVRYAETDQMGYLHHSHYAKYYEVARTDMIRELYASYGQLEKDGIMMPVYDLQCRFISPAVYDEELTVRAIVRELPSVRMVFHYEIYNEQGRLINTGSTTLVFVHAATRRPCKPPEAFMGKMRPFFDTQTL
jgi:acyl-CoA thioester hydrolase